jgi:hypothetical protein
VSLEFFPLKSKRKEEACSWISLKLRQKFCCLNLVSFNSLQIFSSIEIGDETLAPLTGVDGDY